MIRLDTVNRSLQLYLGGATTTNPLQIVVCYSDQTSTSYLGATQLSNSNGTTAVTICSAPAVSTTRDIDMLSVLNTDTVAANVTIQVMDTSTPYQLIYVQLSAQDKLTYTHGSGWQIVTGQGNVKYSVQSVPGVTSFNSRTGVVTLTSSDVTTALTYTPAPQTSGTSLLYGNGSGGFSNVTIGTGVTFSGGTLSATGTGTVTSVGLSLPSIFTVSGSPVTGSGTLTATLASETANTVFAAPNGSSGTPTFRSLVNSDFPTSGVSSGTYGSGSVVPVITVNSQGIVTSVTTAATNAPAYQGTWNASTNTPTLTSSVGTQGYYYVVSVAGTTNLDGNAVWVVGDWAIFGNGKWERIPGSASESFTNLTTANLAVTGLTGYMYANGSSNVTSSTTIPTTALSGTITNAQLANSTISGVALGNNLFNLTAGSNITFSSGTTYNGSAAITINAAAGMVYPGAGIPNSTGSAWGTSYSTTGSGTVVALATSPTLITPILGTPQSGNFSTGTFTWPTFNQNTTGTAANITATSNSTLTTLSALSLPGSQVTGNISGNAANVTGTVAVGNGGTGLTSLTANYIPYGNGTSAFNSSSQLQYNGTYLLVGAASALGGLTNPVAAFTGNPGTTNYVQTYVYNAQNGISSSADLVAYSSNSTDAHGWADLGFTSPTYADPVYTCTGPNEAYLFGSALNSSYSGNLVYATDSTGSTNYHQWYVGGFTQAKSAWKMQLTSSGLQAVALDNTPIGATTASTGKFTTLESTGTATLGDGSTTYIQVVGDASYPSIKAAGGTNTPLVLQPLGTGALQAQKTDSTATGGNTRGANAVDWQTLRSSASMVASGSASVIVGGQNNTSTSYTSFVGAGANNYSLSGNSFVGAGNGNVVNTGGSYASIVAGGSNTINSPYGFIGNGLSNTAAGYFNIIGGGASNSGTSASTVTTQATTTVTSGSTAVTLSGSNASIKVGQLITGTGIVSYTYVSAISGTSLTLSQNANASGSPTLSFYTPHGIVVGGGNNQATGSYSFVGGGGDAGTAGNRNTASGDWSFVGGGWGNQATALGAVVTGGGWFSAGIGAGNTASGVSSYVGGGSGNSASSSYSAIIAGYGNNASATGAIVVSGFQNYATGQYSTTLNGFGLGTRSIYGNVVFGGRPTFFSGAGAGVGASQSSMNVYSGQTTTATPQELVSDNANATPSTTNIAVLPAPSASTSSVYTFRGLISAKNTATTDVAGWEIKGVIQRTGSGVGTVAMVGTPTVTLLGATSGAISAGWGIVGAVTAVADTTNGGLGIKVTGVASTTINWNCRLDTAELL